MKSAYAIKFKVKSTGEEDDLYVFTERSLAVEFASLLRMGNEDNKYKIEPCNCVLFENRVELFDFLKTTIDKNFADKPPDSVEDFKERIISLLNTASQ